MSKKIISIALIGAGNISHMHLDMITSLKKYEVSVLYSRTISKSQRLKKKYHIIKNIVDNKDKIKLFNFDIIMILVSSDQIYSVSKYFISKFSCPIFIEKPPGLSLIEMKNLSKLSIKKNTRVMIGLNRRYYSNINKAIDFIKKNGGIMSFHIEGNERYSLIKKQIKNQRIIRNWIFANSIHTIDLFLFLGGDIKKINIFKNQNKNQDLVLSINATFKNDLIGSYISSWNAPGRWSLTVYGNMYTAYISPLEKGYLLDRNNKKIKLDLSSKDKKFKSGFKEQFLDFVSLLKKPDPIKKNQLLLTNINSHLKIYEKLMSK